MNEIDIDGASLILSVPAFLVRDFTSYQFNGRKLAVKQDETYDIEAVRDYRDHMESSWAGVNRCDPPEFVQRYLVFEARGGCAFCRQQKPHYDFAHIVGWAKTRNHSPHNLLRLCVDCHRSHGEDTKLLRAIKEELLRDAQRIGQIPIYDCDSGISTGEAVFVRDGIVERADPYSGPDGNDDKRLPCGLVQFKFGPNRCTVQRIGVFQALTGLVGGEKYFSSPTIPGGLVTIAEFNRQRDPTKLYWLQSVGRAESSRQLALNIAIPFGLSYGKDI